MNLGIYVQTKWSVVHGVTKVNHNMLRTVGVIEAKDKAQAFVVPEQILDPHQDQDIRVLRIFLVIYQTAVTKMLVIYQE